MNGTLSTDARTIFLQALDDCSVQQAFSRKLSATATHSISSLSLDGSLIADLTSMTSILVLSIGKAALTMLDAFLAVCPLPPGCAMRGVVIAPSPPLQTRHGFDYFSGGHPLPNQDSFAGARAALDLLLSATRDNPAHAFCFFLISGGASAMMELPLDSRISLDETAAFHQALIGSGASIAEINCIRKHFSAVKGGRLALAAAGINHLSLLLSDVPAAHLDALSSGPTLPDPTTTGQCREILHRFDLYRQLPPTVQGFFSSRSIPETPKPGDLTENAFLLLSSDDLQDAAKRHAEALGFATFIDNTCDDWDYRDAAEYLLGRIRSLRERYRRVCLLSAGEVTVALPDRLPSGNSTGGRNLHFTLHSASRLQPEERIVVLSAGSDGIDGNSDAAGAIVDATTLHQHAEEAEEALRAFNSYPLLHRIGATVVTGPTGNNLRDLRILLAEAVD